MNSKSEKSTLLAVFLKLLIFTVAIAAVGAGIGFGFYETSESLWIFIIAYVLGELIADLSVPAEYSWLKKTPEQKREKRETQSELDARYGSDREISDSVDQYGAGYVIAFRLFKLIGKLLKWCFILAGNAIAMPVRIIIALVHYCAA